MRHASVVLVWLAACGRAQPTPTAAAVPTPRLAATPAVAAGAPTAPPDAPGAPGAGAAAAATPIADGYRDVAATIIQAARTDDGAWAKLAHLADRIGARPSGSVALERAVAWAVATMIADGHANVRAEKVMVPHWVRGAGAASLVAPIARPLHLLALGGSPATPRGGLTREVVVVSSFEELEALGPKVKGKIVLFNRVMTVGDDGHATYGDVVPYRSSGPERAAALGAAAALVRSATTRSLRTPHTGATRFDKARPIPAAAIATEDADLIARLAAAGDAVRVKLVLGSKTLPDRASANVLGELTGRERPDEIVVIGAHIDSWDVGDGAHDDGAGVAACMQALTLLRQLGLTPRRTIRVVLWTNEEHGLRGALQYATDHAAELGRHVLAIEMDSGGFAPRGFGIQGPAQAVAEAADIATLLAPIGAGEASAGFAGADIIPLARAGVIGGGLRVDSTRYFDYHHTDADTLDKVDPAALALDVAALAVFAYVVADMPTRFGGAPAAPPAPAAPAPPPAAKTAPAPPAAAAAPSR